MNHPILSHILVLIAAAATTVAGAWLCAALIPDPLLATAPLFNGPSLTGAPPEWEEPVLREAGRRPGLAVAEESWMLVALEGRPDLLTPRAAADLRAAAGIERPALSDRILLTLRRTSAGFPLPALRWTRSDRPFDDGLPAGSAPPVGPLARGLMSLDSRALRALGVQRDRRLPIEPVWPGFAANTLAAAVPIWALLIGLPMLRRRRRLARGRCPSCGYPASPDAACPECGADARPGPGPSAVPGNPPARA